MGGADAKYPERFPFNFNDGGLAQDSPALPSAVETDESGRFEFRGLGADRLVTIQVEGPSIAKTNLLVVTRDMQPLSARPLDMVGVRSGVYYGREFDFVAEPSQPVLGTVTDVDSGEPIADVQISLGRFANNVWSQEDFVSTRTDENGKYELAGLPQGGGHNIKVTPDLAQPYFQENKTLPQTSDSFKPITFDFALKQGKWIVGNVTDSPSGKSISEVNVEYLPLLSNDHASDYAYYEPQITGSVPSDRYRSDDEGKFRVLAIPGRGVLATIARGDDREEFSKLSVGQVSEHLIGKGPRLKTYLPWNPTDYNSLIEVDLSDDVEDAQYDLTLTRGGTKLLRFVDDRGKPVTGVRVLGRRVHDNLGRPTKDPHVKLIGMGSEEQRLVALIHPKRKIGSVLTISPAGDQTVTLEPCAVAHGRFVDSDGQPVPEVVVNVSIDGGDNWSRQLVSPKTDENGRFEVLLPAGKEFRVWHYQRKGPSFTAKFDPQPGATYELGDLTDGVKLTADETAKLMVEVGERQDMETISFSTSTATSPTKKKAAKSVAVKSNDAQTDTIRVAITLPDGGPAEQTHVALKGYSQNLEQHLVYSNGITNSNGDCILTCKDHVKADLNNSLMVARKDGLAVGWKILNRSILASNDPIKISLLDQRVVKGQLIDIDGQPAAGEKLQVETIFDISAVRGSTVTAAARFQMAPDKLPKAWIQPMTTDDDGRFELTGVPENYGVQLRLLDSKRFAPQNISLNTGMPEQRGPNDATYRSIVKNTEPGEEALITLSPAKIITGKVTYEDTNEPVANARVSIWASQQASGGSMHSLEGKTNAEGEYRILPRPGIRFGVEVYPPSGVPYMGREAEELKWENSDTTRNVDIQLPRVTLVNGRVIEKGTGLPVANATITFESSGKNAPKDSITGWQATQKTDGDGKFTYAVPAGHGTLVVRKIDSHYVLKTMESRMMTRGKPGGTRFYANAFHTMEVEKDTDSLDVEIEVLPGKTVRGVIVDGDGKSIEEAIMLTRLKSWDLAGRWRPDSRPVTGGKFELTGLEPGESYKVHFLNVQRKLGATIELKATEEEVKVVLKPCGAATAKFIVEDEDRERLKKQGGSPFFFSLRPGVAKHDFMAQRKGKVAADEVFNTNIDRVNYGKNGPKLDDELRITYPALIPGATYRVHSTFELDGSYKEFVAKSGETLELGELKFGDEDEQEISKENNESTKSSVAAVKSSDAQTDTIRVAVSLPDGSPADQTHVALTSISRDYSKSIVLGSGVTDGSGECTLTCKDLSEATEGKVQLTARKDGLAVSWKALNQSKLSDDKPIKIRLLKQSIVKGRLVDIDGQPVAGEKLQVETILSLKAKRGWFDAFQVPLLKDSPAARIVMANDGPASGPHEAWIQPVTSDEDGRFELTGIAENSGVYIELLDSKRFAPQRIALNTGMREQRGPRDGTYRPLVKNVELGEEAVLTLSPGKVITGKVTYEDTNKPVPNATISIWASQQENGSMISVTGKTNADGKYRVLPKPGIRFGVQVYPPSGVAYMGRKAEELKWENADSTRNVDVQLPRGTLVKGRVIEKGTGKPVSNATITFEGSRRKAPKNAITGWQATQKTDADGKFTYAVSPGHGTLVIRKKNSNYVIQTMESRMMTRDKPGGSRFSANAFHTMKVEEGTDTIEAEIEVVPGQTVRGVIVDRDGKPIEEAIILTRLKSWADLAGWRADSRPVTGGKFELTGLEPGKSYKVHFLDARQKLGTTIDLKATDEEVKVVLQPCGSATAKFIVEDEDNREKMIEMRSPTLSFRLSPGVAKYDFRSIQAGKLAADEDFNGNVDRLNYGFFSNSGPKLDDELGITYPALIPGATYRLQTTFDQSWGYKEFTVEPGQVLDLGEFTPKFSN